MENLKGKFNKLSRKGGECVIRTNAEWLSSGLDTRYGDLPEGKMAICVFAGECPENSRIIRISGMKDDGKKLHIEVTEGILGGPPSRPGHSSYPQDVQFAPLSDKPVKFTYAGVVAPRAKKKSAPKHNP
jgi:hypothetical protein